MHNQRQGRVQQQQHGYNANQRYENAGPDQRHQQRTDRSYPPRGNSQGRPPQQTQDYETHTRGQRGGIPGGAVRGNPYQSLEGEGSFVKRGVPGAAATATVKNANNKKRNTIILIVVIVVVVLGAGGTVAYFLWPKESSSSGLAATTTTTTATGKPSISRTATTAAAAPSVANGNGGSAAKTTDIVAPPPTTGGGDTTPALGPIVQINEGVSKQVLSPGDGVTFPVSGTSTVNVLYNGTFLDGTVFDASALHGNTPFSVVIGAMRVIPCWDVGVPTMSLGEVAELYCKSEWAYGASGSPPLIPPNTDLNFWVSLVSIN